jgi:hypothetical protein
MSDLGDAALAIARQALDAHVREQGGIHRGPEVDKYVSFCVRRGALLHLFGVNWCASFASFCVWTGANLDPTLAQHWTAPPPAPLPTIGYRAAVSELVTDAKATNTWHDVSEGYAPSPGDLCILARDGEDPRTGGLGHVCFVKETIGDGVWDCIGGNQGVPGAVTLAARSIKDTVETIVGWISV